MGAGEAGKIAAGLIAAGKRPSTPAVIVENASLPEEHRYFATLATLSSAASHLNGGPALILLGRVFGEAAGRVQEPICIPASAAA